jgi:hypothetical protein
LPLSLGPFLLSWASDRSASLSTPRRMGWDGLPARVSSVERPLCPPGARFPRLATSGETEGSVGTPPLLPRRARADVLSTLLPIAAAPGSKSCVARSELRPDGPAAAGGGGQQRPSRLECRAIHTVGSWSTSPPTPVQHTAHHQPLPFWRPRPRRSFVE